MKSLATGGSELSKAIKEVTAMLRRAEGRSGSDETFAFVAGQICANVDEVICPQGEGDGERCRNVFKQDVLPCGHGSREGASVTMTGRGVLGEMLEVAQNFLGRVGTLNDLQLQCLGLKRLEKGNVVIRLNGRSIGLLEAEHTFCKNYLQVSVSRGTRGVNVPNPYRPHCHPLLDPASYGMAKRRLDEIFDSAIAGFEKMVEEGSITSDIPEPFNIPTMEEDEEHSMGRDFPEDDVSDAG
jgi:hypothetical protein